MPEPYLSEIRLFPYEAHIPWTWVPCDGRLLPISANRVLYDLIGNTYGGRAEDGTFAIPDLRDRVPIGAAPDYGLGVAGGKAEHTLAAPEMLQHSHLVRAAQAEPDADGNRPGREKILSRSKPDLYGDWSNPDPMLADAVSTVGEGRPHPNEAPYLPLVFCIALRGLLPVTGDEAADA